MEKSVHFVGACYICLSQCAVKKKRKTLFLSCLLNRAELPGSWQHVA